jgi:hypothetical protein
LNKHDFTHLASIIVAVFTTEAAGTYFTASVNGNNQTGKLVSCYSNSRHLLADVGIIARVNRRSTLNETLPVVLEVIPDVIDALVLIASDEWEDKESLHQAWNMTHASRQNDLKTEISTSAYLGKYPFLRQPNGYELVREFASFLITKNNNLAFVSYSFFLMPLQIIQSSKEPTSKRNF